MVITLDTKTKYGELHNIYANDSFDEVIDIVRRLMTENGGTIMIDYNEVEEYE